MLRALAHTRRNGRAARQVRPGLHLDVLRFLPVSATVDGASRGSESGAFAATLEAGVVYPADRNFVDFDFPRAVLAVGSDLVVRLKKGGPNLVVSAASEPARRDAGVRRDERVTLPGSAGTPGLGAGVPLRVVTVFDPVRREEVRLLTTLLDAPAWAIGQLYRQRWWAIELFFRRLKCVAKVEHLCAESENGVTPPCRNYRNDHRATLLMHLRAGHRPSVYTTVLLGSAAAGDLVLAKVPEVLERLARERARELARLRRLKKKQA